MINDSSHKNNVKSKARELISKYFEEIKTPQENGYKNDINFGKNTMLDGNTRKNRNIQRAMNDIKYFSICCKKKSNVRRKR